MEAKKKFVFIINHSFDNPDKVAGAMQLATNMKLLDIELDFFLLDKGVLLAKKGFAETLTWQTKNQFTPVAELLRILVEDFGVNFHICASCVKHYDLDKVELIANSAAKPGSFLAEMLLHREGLTF